MSWHTVKIGLNPVPPLKSGKYGPPLRISQIYAPSENWLDLGSPKNHLSTPSSNFWMVPNSAGLLQENYIV